MKGKTFEWPDVHRKLPSLKKFVDWKDTHKDEMYPCRQQYIHKINNENVYVDVNFLKYTSFPHGKMYSPTLNTHSGLWNIKLHRFANIKEHLKLQGFPLNFKQVVSDTQMKKQLGNSMSVNVLYDILKMLLV